MKLILGSGSKTRIRLLAEAGILVDEVISADINEKAIRSDNLKELPLILARAKRNAILPKIKEPAFMITADTILFKGNKLFEKPTSPEEEYEFFRQYDGVDPLEYVTSITVTNTETTEMREGSEFGKCLMGPFTEKFVEDYIKKGTYINYAGGFTYFDDEFKDRVTFIEGSSPESFLGLPVGLTKKLLVELGYKL